jgi:hypothetical protein
MKKFPCLESKVMKKPIYLKITRVKRKDQDPWNNLQTRGERKDITIDHTTSNKESAKESEILHLENI